MGLETVIGPGWLDEAKAVDLGSILGAFSDLDVRRSMFGPCPACNQPFRDGRRPACGTRGDSWHCWRCNVSGGPIALVFWRLCGEAPSAGSGNWYKVRDWFASYGWCSPRAGERRLAPKPLQAAKGFTPASVERPPSDEVRGLLKSALRPADADPDTLAWFEDRQLDPARIPAGVLPLDYWWPKWWPYENRDQTRGVYRLAVPAYDDKGAILSLHARAVLTTEEMVERKLYREKKSGGFEVEKTRWPAHFASVGLIFADPWRGRGLLRGQPTDVRRIVVTEGLTDFLATSSAYRDQPDVAVYGGTEGCWSTFGKVAWPSSAEFYLATDPDSTGDRFARTLTEQLFNWPCYRIPLHSLGAA